MPLILSHRTGRTNAPRTPDERNAASRVAVVGAALLAALAAWLSQGLVGDASSGSRIGLLPTSWSAIGIALLVGFAIAALVRKGASLLPLFLLVLPMLSWLPQPPPPAFRIWLGPLTLAVWLTVGWCMLRSIHVYVAAEVRHPQAVAGVLAFVLFSLAAWRVSPSIPGGDEPHYLIITQSILYDGDLQIENNHLRGDYHGYFSSELKPDYLRRGRNGQIYSIHSPGVSLLVLPAFALAGYNGVVAFLILLSSVAAALAWHLAHRVTGRTDAAWFGWAAVVFAPVMTLNAFTVYPDGPGSLVVLTGLWALVRARDERASGAMSVKPWLLHGGALATLPWLHTRFALLAGGFGALVLLHLARTKNPVAKACGFLALPTLSALVWIGFFTAIYGVPDPAIPYRGSDLGSPAYVAGGFTGLLFDQQYGLLPYAPVLASGFAGLVALWRMRGAFRWLPVEMLFVAVPYLLTVTHFAMWWGGFSTAARFSVPLLPSLAIPAAAAWSAAEHRGTRSTLIGLLGATIFICAVLVVVDGGRLAYYARDSYARSLEWLGRTVDLQHGLPSFFSRVVRGRPGELFYIEVLVWMAALAIGWLALRALDRSPWMQARARLATATAMIFIAAVMGALSIVWQIEHVSGITDGAPIYLLRRAGGDERMLAVDLSQGRRVPLDAVPPSLDVRFRARRTVQFSPRGERPLFELSAIPAGEYNVSIRRRQGRGWLMAGIARDQFALLTRPVDEVAQGVTIRFPVDVRGLIVRGDEDAQQEVEELQLRPVSLVGPNDKPSKKTARHAVRYNRSTIFFMDDGSFPEPNGFWVGGPGESTIVVQPDQPRRTHDLLLRNAPVENVITLESTHGRQDLVLAPDEERRVEVPFDIVRGATRVTFRVTSGFRPSAVDPASRDARFLGVWVRVGEESTK